MQRSLASLGMQVKKVAGGGAVFLWWLPPYVVFNHG